MQVRRIVAAPLAMLALGAMLLAPHSASADQRDFTLVNHTGPHDHQRLRLVVQ